MNLRELLDNMPEHDRKWLESNRASLVPDDVPDAVRWALTGTIEHMIDPRPDQLDQVS